MAELEYILKNDKQHLLNSVIFLKIVNNELVIREKDNENRLGALKMVTVKNIPDDSFALSFDYKGAESICARFLSYLKIDRALKVFYQKLEKYESFRKIWLGLSQILKRLFLTRFVDNKIFVFRKYVYRQFSWLLYNRHKIINKRCDFIIITPVQYSYGKEYVITLGEIKSKNLGKYYDQLLNSCVFFEYIINLVNEFYVKNSKYQQKIKVKYNLVVLTNSPKINKIIKRPITAKQVYSSESNLSIDEITIHKVKSEDINTEIGFVYFNELLGLPSNMQQTLTSDSSNRKHLRNTLLYRKPLLKGRIL